MTSHSCLRWCIVIMETQHRSARLSCVSRTLLNPPGLGIHNVNLSMTLGNGQQDGLERKDAGPWSLGRIRRFAAGTGPADAPGRRPGALSPAHPTRTAA